VNRCPHKKGPLSQGIVHGHSVACPLHNWNIALATGEAQGEDKGCTPVVPVKIVSGRVLICRASALKAAA
jgi:nitrite reductase (NADH) small subunit